MDAEAKLAYEALMTLRLFEPSGDELTEFQAELQRRRLQDFNLTSPPGEPVSFIPMNVSFKIIPVTYTKLS